MAASSHAVQQSAMHRFSLPIVPASYFGMVLGLGGLGSAWRTANRVWGVSGLAGELILLLAVCIWGALFALYVAKWVVARDAARAELENPVQCCFVGLIGVATSIIAMAVFPYSALAAQILFLAGAAATLGFALWRTGLLWRGGREAVDTTPILYLPLVAGAFVTATTAGLLGYRDWGQLAFGAGLFSWLAIESVLLHRLYTGPALPPALRPTLGIQLAPPTVGAVTYLSVSGGGPDMISHALIGYGLLQALILIRMLPWTMEQPFAPSYWAFTFGATALANGPMLMVEQGEVGAVAKLAPYLFGAANLIVGLVALRTLLLVVQSPPVKLGCAPAHSPQG